MVDRERPQGQNSLNSSPISSALIRAILEQYTLPLYGLHGVAHWGRVYTIGQRLCTINGARTDVAALFAVFHDACRVSDGTDHHHGRRGAELTARLRGRYFDLDDAGFDLLVRACNEHTHGLTQEHLSVQTCWDSDRLDLARAAILPNDKYLCTEAARRPDIKLWATRASLLKQRPTAVLESWGINGRNRADWQPARGGSE